MKPSEKIQELAESTDMDFSIRGTTSGYITAILQYLDEQWEKNKPCEHGETDKNVMGDIACLTCSSCGEKEYVRFK